MRMMLTASLPNEPFNSLARAGRFRIAMVAEDLQKAGLDALGQRWK